MAKEITSIDVAVRERAGKGASRSVRRQGMIPGVIYGDKKNPVIFSIDPKVLNAEMHKAGFWTRQFEINVDGKKHKVMCQDIQVDPVSDKVMHIDFIRINKNKELHLNVPIRVINNDISVGLKRGGVLNIVRREIEVICKVISIPDVFEIDISEMDIGDSVHMSEITLSEGVRLSIIDRDPTVIAITAPKTAETEIDEESEAEDEDSEESTEKEAEE
ncbi:MAG: 50S ribosomal protein L25/general stress protein Ctc [Alphaproteobacteria bacterium]|nr:50S ribosomal protein L25/general stress protein Ctc [Alphaproteobacteria bacterium]